MSPSPRRRYRSAGCQTPRRRLWLCWEWSLQHPEQWWNSQWKYFLPEVWVLARESLAQIGSVTYLATRECLDLISGKVSDIAEVAGGCFRTNGAETGESLPRTWLLWSNVHNLLLTAVVVFTPQAGCLQRWNKKLVLLFTCKVWTLGASLLFST